METDLALLVRLVVLGEVDVDRLSTTTLGVLDGGSGGLAGSDLPTLGTILHCVVKLKVNIVLNRDVDVCDGETRLSLITAERSRLLLAYFVLDALGSE